MDDDEDWTIPKKPKRRKSLFITSQKRDKTKRVAETEDWCIPKIPKRRQSYMSDLKQDSEDDEPITIDKVLSFLNGDDDLIKFTSIEPASKPNASPEEDLHNDETANTDDFENISELKPDVDELEIEEHNMDSDRVEKKYKINVSVEVESGDNEFNGDSSSDSESILIPEIPPSDEDEDLTNVFGERKPIITSVTSLRENGEESESEDVDILSVDESKTQINLRRPKTIFKKTYTHDHTVVTERHGDLLTPIRYVPIYENKEKRRQKPKNRYEYEYPAPKSCRRIRCDHCNDFFYSEDLEEHMIEVKSANNKIMDKLLQIPVVKVIDVAKDENLDPKLKAKLKDQIFKLENRSLNYTLRHCVHCNRTFTTLKQMHNHIIDVIFGLNILKKGKTVFKYKVKLQRNNY